MTEPLPQPVASDFNLEPVTTERIVPKVTSVDALANTNDYRTGSEFGGVMGIVQPPPHVPTARERRMAIMFIDPTDPGTEDGSVRPPDLEGDFA